MMLEEGHDKILEVAKARQPGKMSPTSPMRLFEWSENPLKGGGGGFGAVYKITSKGANGKSYACKVIKMAPDMDMDDIHNEIRAVQKICSPRHENIVEVISICKSMWKNSPAYFMQMELCDGDMDSYIRWQHQHGKSIRLAEIAGIMLQVLDGLVFIHSNDEVHRDLKPKNILYVDIWTIAQTEVAEPVKRIWKIADFGFTSPANSGYQLPSGQGRMTPGYCAPELLLSQTYSKKVDIWAVGCTTYELSTGKRAFRTNQEVLGYIWHPTDALRVNFDTEDADDSKALNILIIDCLARDARARPDSRSVRYRFEQIRTSIVTRSEFLKLSEDGVLESSPSVSGRELINTTKHNAGDKARELTSTADAAAAYTVCDRAAICLEQGRYKEAEKLYEWALGIRETKLGDNHRDTASTIYGLATTYLNQGQYKNAERLYRRCIQIYEQIQKDEPRETVRAINGLGTACRMQGRYVEAEQQYDVALDIFEKVEGRNDLDKVEILYDLGVSYGCRGKYDLEAKMYEKVFEIRNKFCGDDHPGTANAIRAVGISRHHRGEYEVAETMHRWALQIQEKILGKEHPDTLETMNNLGLVALARARVDEAKMLHQSVLEIQSNVLGNEHPRIAETLHYLGVVYRHQKQYEKQVNALEQALGIQERTLGKEHPQRAMILNDLGAALILQRRYQEAESVYNEALGIVKKTFKEEHPSVAKTLGGLGIVKGCQGRHGTEEKMLQKALQISVATLGRTHPDTARLMYNLAAACLNLKRHDDAERYFRCAIEVWEKTLGTDHPYTISSRASLSSLSKPKSRFFKKAKR